MDTNETNPEDAANASRLKTAAPAAVADPEPDPEPEPERDGLPLRQRRVVLGIMVSGTTAACISQSMMIAALPAVMHEYGISASSGQLLTTAYIFVLGLISAMTGYLMNRFDSKKLFFASMASFAVGCAAAIFAPNYPCLLAARLLQAGGAGICLPLVQLVALNIYPKSQYGQATAIVGMIIGFAPAIGPTISGFLIDAWGWRSMFWMLGAIALAVMVLTVLLLDDVVRRPDHPGHFDPVSALLYSGGFVLVMIAATMLESGGFVGAGFIAPLLLGVAGLVVFARRQLRVPEPFLRLQCFRDKMFAVSTLIVICAHMMFMAPSIMVPLFVQDIQGLSATVSGLTLLPGAIMMGVMNPITGRLLDRRGPRPLIVAGCITVLAGTVAFALIPASVPEWVVTVLYGIRVTGIACLMMPLTAWACTTLDPDELAQASAIITSARQLIGSLSASVFIAVMALTSQNALGVDLGGFDFSFWLQCGVPVIAFVLGMFVLPKMGSVAK